MTSHDTDARPEQGSPDRDPPDLVARLEALKQLLDAAKEQELPVINSTADTGHAETGAAMPKFLSDPETHEPTAARSSENASRQTWSEKFKAATGPDRAQWAFFLATIMGSAALLFSLEYLDLGHTTAQRSIPQRPDTRLTEAEPARPDVRLNFMSEATCESPPCDALSTSISRTIATMPIDAAQSASPGIVYATNPNIAVYNRSTVDPLDQVTVKGLPANVRLSVGQKISDSEWTLAAGDLSDIGIVVPSDYADPIRATIEIKKREGEPLTALGLTIEREAPMATEAESAPPLAFAEPEPIDPLLSMAPIDPAAMQTEEKAQTDKAQAETESDGRSEAGEKLATPVSNAAAKSTKPAKTKVRQKKTKPVEPPAQAVAETAKPPATLFEGLFPSSSSSSSSAAAKQAPAATAFTNQETPSSDENPVGVPLPPSATVANQPAGFETLRGLGGGFGLAPP